MKYKIINAISSKNVPKWGNEKKYIVLHYLGVVGQNHDIASDGCGAHYYIYWDGTIYQRCSHDAIVWAVGTAGYYQQKHPIARNGNTISIEMCCKCDGNSKSAEDPYWYFTKETQEAAVELVQKLMKELNVPAENVLRHYDVVNKTCPAPYVRNNKYKTSWTWNEFKAKLAGAESDEKAYGMKLTDIAKYVQAEFGIAAGKNYNCLLGVAQCMHDIYRYANPLKKSLADSIKANFTAPSTTYAPECLQAVKDVFVNGKVRFKDVKLLQYRSFTKYSDGKGNPDKKKCASLLEKYEYLGNDYINMQYGHLYFGEKIAAEKKPDTDSKLTPYRVGTAWKNGKCVNQTNAYSSLENAKKEADKQTAAHGVIYYVFDATSNAVYKPSNLPISKEYMVRVTTSALNIRSGAGEAYKKVGLIKDKGTYTIVEEKDGWGRLKSGAGWICLKYTKRI